MQVDYSQARRGPISAAARTSSLRRFVAPSLCLGLLATTACTSPPPLVDNTGRHRNGIVYILPGIEGKSLWNQTIAAGLDAGGVASAIEIHDWTTPIPGGMVQNLTDYQRNLREAEGLAHQIVDYQRDYPDRPVHLVGHSGGAGIAVLALEALPEETQVDMAILLAATLSPAHDLSSALRRTRHGICSFYSERDVGLLKVGTTLFGQIDRGYGPAAGAVGFDLPAGLSDADRELYARQLRQVRWHKRLEEFGADGSHIGWTTQEFSREFVAPLIVQDEAARPLPAEYVK